MNKEKVIPTISSQTEKQIDIIENTVNETTIILHL